jgi:hypothetical protein
MEHLSLKTSAEVVQYALEHGMLRLYEDLAFARLGDDPSHQFLDVLRDALKGFLYGGIDGSVATL